MNTFKYVIYWLAVMLNFYFLETTDMTVSKFCLKLKYCHHLLTLKSFQTSMSFFLLLNTKENIFKNVCTQTAANIGKKILWKSMGTSNCLVNNNL